MQRPYQSIAGAVAALAMTSSPARADAPDDLDASYLVDGGAVPLLWLPLAGSLVLSRWPEARRTPLGFDHDEGGAPSQRADELPAWVITAGAGVLGVSMALGDDPSRHHHLKGLAQSLATTALVTKLGKAGFGRHRPDYDPLEPGDGGRRSFPSGHSAQAAAAAMYAGLYLRHHVFAELRPAGTLPWWEAATYGGLAALAGGVAYERVARDRHHASDVIAGGLIGAGTAFAIFTWQERRYRAARRGDSASHEPPLVLPAPDGFGFQLSGTF